jgi:hypothetical protein
MMAEHKRKKVCAKCGSLYEYIWRDEEAWVELITCPQAKCRVIGKSDV